MSFRGEFTGSFRAIWRARLYAWQIRHHPRPRGPLTRPRFQQRDQRVFGTAPSVGRPPTASSIAANSTCGVYCHRVSRPARELACIEPLRVPRKAKVSQRYAATADGWEKGPRGDSFYPRDRGRSRAATSGRDRRSVCTILPTPLERIYPPSRREPVRRLSFPSAAICTSYLSQVAHRCGSTRDRQWNNALRQLPQGNA